VQFIQSIHDFPQMIKLGEKTPSFGLNRFKQKLRFVPTDDEGFTLRGDKRQIIYKGRRRSHRFTILDNSAFEYDCILKKEPDSNVIRLRIEGSENYDFFRQPDFVENPFLKWSYAVYKKETLIGEGTGKLCHIHRPEIIDARGRRCWGSLAVFGNELRITIPEKWLADAVYPVIVDPTVGTTTVGSQEMYSSGNYSYHLILNDDMALNKVLIPENVDGNGTFYVYKTATLIGYTPSRIYPCIYNDVNNLPKIRLSNNEQLIFDNSGGQAAWLEGTLSTNSPINSGNYIWFGVRGRDIGLRFDYGGGVFENVNIASPYYSSNILIPNDLNGDYIYFVTKEVIKAIRVSMYLTFEQPGNNYNKILVETARVNDNLSKTQTLLRYCIDIARISITFNALRIFAKICSIIDNLRIDDTLSKTQTFFRRCVTTAHNRMTLNTYRLITKISHIIDGVFADTRAFSSKGLSVKVTDYLKAEGVVIRKLFVSLRIRTNSFIRSVFNKRFLNSKVEITLKSRIGETNRNEE